MRIQLIHPPHPEAIEDRLDAPLGLLYVASSARAAGHRVHLSDLAGKPRDAWDIVDADVYGITVYGPTVDISAELARMCKRRNPEAKVIAGGAHPTGLVNSGVPLEGYIPAEFDAVVVGEGEMAILDVARDYPNLKPVYNRPLEKDLDSYPNPDYSMVDPFSYKRTIAERQSISMLTSRGCPYRCSFCGLPAHHRKVKYRSPEAVVAEVKGIIDRYGIRSFNFQDDTFLVHKRRVKELLDLLKPLKISFRCHGRAGLDTQDDYHRLKEAGCELIAWGIESGSQKLLELMNKDVTVEQNEAVIGWAKNAGILDRAFFIIGFPGETWETIEETKRFIERADPSQFIASTFQPYPGTDVWTNPEKYGVTRIERDFANFVQIDESGSGKCNVETRWLDRHEFVRLEQHFRGWLAARGRKGPLLEYEKRLEDRAASSHG